MRRLRVLLRVWIRKVRRYLDGSRWTVLLPNKRKIAEYQIRTLLPLSFQALSERRKDNRDLLTGMRVALMFGPLPHWEMPYRNAFQPRPSGGRPIRQVGKPLVTKYPNLTTVGETMWAPDYVTRKEMLESRRQAKLLKRGGVK